MTAILGRIQIGAHGPTPMAWGVAVDIASSRDAHEPNTREHGSGTSVVRARAPGDAHGLRDGLLVAIDGRIDDLGERDGESPVAALARRFRAEGTALFDRLSGRYALAVADLEGGEVHLTRDRLGNRPLYYARTGDAWCWSSEPPPLYALLPERRLDPAGVEQAVHYRWLVGTETLVQGVRQVRAGTCVTLGPQGDRHRETRPTAFRSDPEAGSIREYQDRLHELLRRAVRCVPPHGGRLAVLLSGGVDSSLLAALAVEAGLDCLALTPHWPEYPNPELPRAVRFAKHLGIEHRVVECDDAWVRNRFPWVIERLQALPKHYHTFGLARVFEEVEGEVELFLYGEGADTLFGGRDKILRVAQKRRLLERIPAPLRLLAAAPLPRDTRTRWGRLKELLLYDMEQVVRHAGKVDTGPLLKEAFPSLDFVATPSPGLFERYPVDGTPLVLRRKGLVFLAFMTTALETVDRVGSPRGIQVYSPFLTDPVVDLGLSMPHDHRADRRGSKPIVKDIGARYFPEAWMWEPKLGFPTPISGWLGGPLADALARAADGHPALEGIFRPEVVERLHLERDYELVWAAMCLTEFARRFLGEHVGSEPQPA